MPRIRPTQLRQFSETLAHQAEDWRDPNTPTSLRRYCFLNGVAHLLAYGKAQRAEALLADFDYAMARLESENGPGARPLEADYMATLSAGGLADSESLGAWESFFRERIHILARGNENWPAHKILLQLAVEHADDSPVTRAAEAWLERGRSDWFWLRNARRALHSIPDPCRRVLDAFSWPVNGTLLLRDGGVLTWAGNVWAIDSGSMLVWDPATDTVRTRFENIGCNVSGALELAAGDILSWGGGTLDIHDATSGILKRHLSGYIGNLQGAVELRDNRVLSWGDKAMCLWDATTGESIAELRVGTPRMDRKLELLILPDGGVLATARDFTLRIWDGSTGAERVALDRLPHTERADDDSVPPPFGSDADTHALALLHGDVVTWGRDADLRVWDSASGELRSLLHGHETWVAGALELYDGRVLSWSSDKTLRVWDAATGHCGGLLRGHTGEVSGALVLANGNILSWSKDATLRIWDSVSVECTRVLRQSGDDVTGVQELPDGGILSRTRDNTLENDRELAIWDPDTGIRRATFPGGKQAIEGTLALPNGRLLTWTSGRNCEGHALTLWDSMSGASLGVYRGHTDKISGARLLPDGNILSWSDDRTLRVWDLASTASHSGFDGHGSTVKGSLALSPSQVLTWGARTLHIWDTDTGACQRVLDKHTAEVNGSLVLPDGSSVLSWSEDATLRVWSVTTGRCERVLGEHKKGVIGALLLAGTSVLSWSRDGTMRVWDWESGTCKRTMDNHAMQVDGAVLLPNGRSVLSWSWVLDGKHSTNGTLQVWDTVSGASLGPSVNAHRNHVQRALVMSNGSILSWGGDETLRVWDADTFACILELKGHEHHVRGALELSEGRILSCALDRTIRMWDASSGACVAVLRGHESGVDHIRLLESGEVVSWSTTPWFSDHTFRIWNLEDRVCRAIIQEGDALFVRPDPVAARSSAATPKGWAVGNTVNFVVLAHTTEALRAAWHASSGCVGRAVFPDGTVATTLEDGRVVFLKLHHGARRVSLDEAASLALRQDGAP